MESFRLLKPTKQRPFKKKIYGFDVETYSEKNHFYCASIYGDDYQNMYYDKREMIDDIKRKPIFRDSWIAATNLSFDFFELFMGEKEIEKSKFLWRGSDLICAKLRLGVRPVTFIDTLNYAKLSVEKLGKIINLPKLKKPAALGREPETQEEFDELIRYNMRDSEVSQKFIKFLYDAFYELGATPKMTIASSAMSLFKNKYLKNNYFGHPENILLEQFQGYYGGRVEVFKRGKIEDYNYYDFNSLYPSVMRNSYPDPNSLRISNKNDINHIENYEGMSDVEIYCPRMDIPLLPHRHDNKLLFPCGTFRSWQSHVELRKAIELGYVIKKVYKTHYYKEECSPFNEYVDTLYNLRKRYKREGNNMQLVVKLLMNSLYGKFGQKFMNKDEWQPFPENIEELEKYKNFDRVGDFIRIMKEYTKPSSFCIPIWAIYTTAYGRLKLYEKLLRCDPVYCDTDSIITKKNMGDSDVLGKLKKELSIIDGILIKPKFYCLHGEEEDYVKAKGCGFKMSSEIFKRFIIDPKITYKKFMRFKESVRRGFKVNEIIDFSKEFSLEDDKRDWDGARFDPNLLQRSSAVDIDTLVYKDLYINDNSVQLCQEMIN